MNPPKIVIALLLSFGFLVALGAAAGELAECCATAPLDEPVEGWFDGFRESWVEDLMRIVTQAGSSGFLVPFGIVAGLALRAAGRGMRPLVLLAAAYLGSLALTHGVKAIVDRPRPFTAHPVERFTGSAFPSGHAAKAAAVFLVLGALLAAGMSRLPRAALWSASLLLVVLVAFSRLSLGVHWLSDVLAGTTFGAVWAAAVLKIVGAEPRRT